MAVNRNGGKFPGAGGVPLAGAHRQPLIEDRGSADGVLGPVVFCSEISWEVSRNAQ